MYQTKTGRYDEIPDGMKRYINNYGCHFNRKLCEEAIGRMYKIVNGEKKRAKVLTKEYVDNLLNSAGIRLERGKLYDSVYVANMCANDFLGKAVPDEQHLALFIKDMIDDPDAKDGYIFNRFYADCIFMNNPIEWEDMV